MIIPSHIQIETVGGICTANCTMCTINQWSRKKSIMSNEIFQVILRKISKYKENIQYMTLHGCGEPLLDSNLPDKIQLAKKAGFKGTGFATNCTELTSEMSFRLLAAGLDTIICSIDGIDKETHEKIRIGTNFENVVNNIEAFIKIRNSMGAKTRVMIRFIRQTDNYNQWELFYQHWSEKLNANIGDIVVKFDVHNWGAELKKYESKDINMDKIQQEFKCEDLFSRVLIYVDGSLGLCCADDNGYFDIGNILNSDPIELFNNEIFSYYRKMMNDGKVSELEHCKHCTIPRSRYLKEKQ
jgi:organic radical activating enzyme